ncbi:hypothetical protein [Streptomyces venezuelae]|nr:hypothetical protein [Streptomyces venezuelae]
MAELAGYARFRDAMERAHTTVPDSARAEREPAAAAGGVTTSPTS